MKELINLTEQDIAIYKEFKTRFRRYKSSTFTQEEFPKYKSTIEKFVQADFLESVGVDEAYFYIMKCSFKKFEIEVLDKLGIDIAN